jgi:transcriptional regulator with XRE-family HTH domain
MRQARFTNHLRFHRKRSGLSQSELARLIGYPNGTAVSRHERLSAVPPLDAVLRYQVVFRVEISVLFPWANAEATEIVEASLKELECELHNSTAKGRSAAIIARKLEWMWRRSNPEAALLDDESAES